MSISISVHAYGTFRLIDKLEAIATIAEPPNSKADLPDPAQHNDSQARSIVERMAG
jgi:hypothetical protein